MPFAVYIPSELNDLSVDVLVASPALGDLFTYNGTKWVNQDWLDGNLGVGSDQPSMRFWVDDDPDTTWFNGQSSSLKTGSRGWHASKDKTSAHSLAFAFHSDGAPCWEIALDEDTNNSLNSGFGNADWKLVDYSAGKLDNGLGIGDGAAVLRVTPAEATGDDYPRFEFGSAVATPAARNALVTVRSPKDLVGLSVRAGTGQSENLQEWQDDTGAALTFVDSAGLVRAPVVTGGNGTQTAHNPLASFVLLGITDDNTGDATACVEINSMVDTTEAVDFYGTCFFTFVLNNPNAPIPNKELFQLFTEGTYDNSGALLDHAMAFYDISTVKYPLMLEGGGANRTSLGRNIRSWDGQLTIACLGAGTKGITIKPDTAATANQQEWQNSSGAVQMAVGPNGRDWTLDTAIGTIWGTVGGAAGQKQAWWGATPIVQPLLATGAAHTVDDVITTLQTLGLCRQT